MLVAEGLSCLGRSPCRYHEACLFAYCAGSPSGQWAGRAALESVCATLASYAQDCAARAHRSALEEARLLR